MARAPVVLLAGLACVAATTFFFVAWLGVSNPTIAALTYVLIVFLVAASGVLWAAVATSVAAMLCFNYFFLPPVGTLTIADPQNWVALGTLLIVSLAVSHLSSVARARAAEAIARRNETTRLFDFSRDVLVITEGPATLAALATSLTRRFGLAGVTVAVPGNGRWDRYAGGAAQVAVDDAVLTQAMSEAEQQLEFDARTRSYSGHRRIRQGDQDTHLVPIRLGTRAIGVLAVHGPSIDPGTLDAMAGLVAIAIERTTSFESRRQAEVARQSEALKTALLSSLAHDLRTPLTAIRVAADNLKADWLTDEARREQGQLIQTEVLRLNRIFDNILQMARIDAGGVVAVPAWVHPSEIVANARALVEPAVRGRDVRVVVEPDRPVNVDPRLTATALAHLLENAAQYSPTGSPIEIDAGARPPGLVMSVRDYGPGVPQEDVARVFEPFFRGPAASQRAAGTGMGLAIARGLLAGEGGRVWADNCADGGARFTMVVEAPDRDAPAVAES